MKPLALTLVLALVAGCATTPVVPAPLINARQVVEAKPLPPDPALEALPAGTPLGDWVEALEAASCLDKAGKPVSGAPSPCPSRSGIAISEERATRDALRRIRYPELRSMYEADRQLWAAHRELYEERIRTAQEELKKAQPNWWQQHGPALGMVGGFVVGAAATIAITFAIHQSAKP
jgi:hypothetical protein